MMVAPSVLGGQSVTLAWDANTEPDLAGYIVHYGAASGSYTNAVDVGNTTTATVSNLVESCTYYFAVTAYNTSGLESDPSNEVSYSVPLASPLAAWQTQFFTVADLADPNKQATVWGDSADPDHDGYGNLMEYALGRNPAGQPQNEPAVRSEVRTEGNSHYHYLIFSRRKNDTTLQYAPQVSEDKQNWNSGMGSVIQISTTTIDDNLETVAYKDLTPINQGQPRFFHLAVSRNAGASGTVTVASEVFVAAGSTIVGQTGKQAPVSYFAMSFVQPAVAAGTITALGTNSVSDAQATWADGQYDGTNGAFYLEFASGLMVDIEGTDALNGTLTVPGDVRSSVAVGDAYKIRKHATLETLFGANNQAGLLAGSRPTKADTVVLFNALTQSSDIFFYCNTVGYEGWYRSDYTRANNNRIYPEQAISVTRRIAGDVQVAACGVVKNGPTVVPIASGNNLLGTLKALRGLKLSELGLFTGSSVNGLAGGARPSAADNLIIPGSNGSTSYFYCTTAGYEGWYDSAYNAAGTVEIAAGGVFFIKRKSATGFNWIIPAE